MTISAWFGVTGLLTTDATWESNSGKDQWGNESYAAPVPFRTVITSNSQEFGTDEGNNRVENIRVTRVELIADAIGVKIKDRITLPGGMIVYVDSVDTPKDERGNDLLHTVRASTTEKG